MKELDPLSSGDNLRLRLDELFAEVAALRRTSIGTMPAPLHAAIRSGELPETPDDFVLVQNNSGAARDVTDILGISDSFVAPSTSDATKLAFEKGVVFVGVVPTSDHKNKFVVLAEPIGDGAIGRAWAGGVCPVLLSVANDSDTTAQATVSDTTKLGTGTDGAAQILWKESGTGEQWAIIRFGGVGGSSTAVKYATYRNGAAPIDSANHKLQMVPDGAAPKSGGTSATTPPVPTAVGNAGGQTNNTATFTGDVTAQFPSGGTVVSRASGGTWTGADGYDLSATTPATISTAPVWTPDGGDPTNHALGSTLVTAGADNAFAADGTGYGVQGNVDGKWTGFITVQVYCPGGQSTFATGFPLRVGYLPDAVGVNVAVEDENDRDIWTVPIPGGGSPAPVVMGYCGVML